MEKKNFEKKTIDQKPVEKPPQGGILDAWDYTEFESNALSLSKELKAEISAQGLDWRFINRTEYARKGNRHGAAWKPYNIKNRTVVESFKGIDPEGILTRGDLILAVRPKLISGKFREQKAQRNALYKGYNKTVAGEMKQLAREHGVSDKVKIHEGYEENDGKE